MEIKLHRGNPPCVRMSIRSDAVYVVGFGDLHVGNEKFDEKKAIEVRDWIKGNNCIWFGMGDLFENAMITSPGVTEQIMSPREQRKYLLNFLKPIAHQCGGLIDGNHECFDEETEILTKRGWLRFNELSYENLIGTYNIEKNMIEYQNPNKIISYDYNDEMYFIKNSRVELFITPEHRLYHACTNKKWKIDSIKNIHIGNNRIWFKIAGNIHDSGEDKKDFDISNDWIKLAAWILTDGHYFKMGNYTRIHIYQNHEKSNLIKEILDRLNIKYRYYTRQRDTRKICDRNISKPKLSGEFHILSPDYNKILLWIPDKHHLPSWIHKLSNKQFDIFLETFVDGDGCKHKSRPESSWMIYGEKEILEEMQIACIIHNQCAILKEYRTEQWKLNIPLHRNVTCVDRFQKNVEKKHYKGLVWDVNVPNDTLIVRRNGKPIITGNSRLFNKQGDLLIEILAELLEVPYLGMELFSVITSSGVAYSVYGVHSGMASKTAGLAMNVTERDIEKMLGSIEIVLRAHTHYCAADIVYFWDIEKKHLTVNKVPRALVLTGSFLDHPRYIAKKPRRPMKTGTVALELGFDKNQGKRIERQFL